MLIVETGGRTAFGAIAVGLAALDRGLAAALAAIVAAYVPCTEAIKLRRVAAPARRPRRRSKR